MVRTAHTRRGRLLLIAGVCVLLIGCADEPRPASDGILHWIFPEVSPLQAAKMADNAYDANDRYRGTLMLANATYAGEPVYIDLFERRIVDEDANARSAGARGLANHGGARHVAMLVAALKEDPDAFVRREAARGLQRLHGEAAISPLIKATRPASEPDRDARAAAATALGQYLSDAVLDALMSSLEEDSQLSVNRAALESLRTLTGQDFGLSRTAWLNWRATVNDPFAGRHPYIYPVFKRGKYFYEYLPFVPDPPNEVAAQPVGMPPELREPGTPENPPGTPGQEPSRP